MIQTKRNTGSDCSPAGVKHPVRLTALLYLKDALKNESYELCQDIVAVAREFGATESEVQGLLEDPRRSPG